MDGFGDAFERRLLTGVLSNKCHGARDCRVVAPLHIRAHQNTP